MTKKSKPVDQFAANSSIDLTTNIPIDSSNKINDNNVQIINIQDTKSTTKVSIQTDEFHNDTNNLIAETNIETIIETTTEAIIKPILKIEMIEKECQTDESIIENINNNNSIPIIINDEKLLEKYYLLQ